MTGDRSGHATVHIALHVVGPALRRRAGVDYATAGLGNNDDFGEAAPAHYSSHGWRHCSAITASL